MLEQIVQESFNKLPVFDELVRIKSKSVSFVHKATSNKTTDFAPNSIPFRFQEEKHEKIAFNINPEQSCEDEENKLNLTGTPLECPFDLDVLKEDIDNGSPQDAADVISPAYDGKYYPVNVQVARTFLSKLTMEQNKPDGVPCFVLCDSKDVEKTVLLGLQKVGRSIHTWQITRDGPFAVETLANKLDSFKQEFGALSSHSKVISEAFAVFDAYRSPDEELNNHIKLDCTWPNPRQLLELPPASSSTTIKGRAAPGDVSSPAYRLWQELEWLQQLFYSLDTKEISWKRRDSSNTVPLEEQVDQVLEQATVSHKRPIALEPRDDDRNLELLVPVRQALDVTDSLWELLLNCENYTELTAVLRRALDCAESKTQRIRLTHSKNSSQMASLMLGVAKGTTSMPALQGLQPLELLVDMGVEKLKNDYFFTLTSSELATPNLVSSFFPKRGDFVGNLREYWAKSLTGLSILHNILEALCLMRRTLGLERSTLANFALDLISHPVHIEGNNFRFSLQTAQLESFWEMHCVQPQTWSLKCSSELDKEVHCAWQCRKDKLSQQEEPNMLSSPVPKVASALYWIEHMKHICHD